MISSLFFAILYQPIFNLFIWLYDVLPGHDLGLVILVITVAVRLILYPLTASSIKAQKAMQDLQPKMNAIKTQFPNDKQKQSQATMELYKNNKINPLTSCLPMLVQLPILLALYWSMRDGLAGLNFAKNLYGFVANPGHLNAFSFGFLDLSKASIVLALLAGFAQYLQAKMMSRTRPPANAGPGSKDEDMTAMMNKQMLYFMPAMTVLIGFRLPAALTAYWFLSTAFMVLQQKYIFKGNTSTTPPTTPPTDAPAVIEGQIVK